MIYYPSKLPSGDLSSLKEKRIGFLGSSVTYGWASNGYSFVDALEEKAKIIAVKEAVSGTTLVNEDSSSYVARLKKMDFSHPFDAFLIQLSTNDASKQKTLGEERKEPPYDDLTICGAIQTMVAFLKDKGNFPICFYSNPYYENCFYQKMVNFMNHFASIQKEIHFFNLYEDLPFNEEGKEKGILYMADSIHPTKEGYLEWWTPIFEKWFTLLLS